MADTKYTQGPVTLRIVLLNADMNETLVSFHGNMADVEEAEFKILVDLSISAKDLRRKDSFVQATLRIDDSWVSGTNVRRKPDENLCTSIVFDRRYTSAGTRTLSFGPLETEVAPNLRVPCVSPVSTIQICLAEMCMDPDHEIGRLTKKVKVQANETKPKPGTVPRYGLGPGRALSTTPKESGYSETVYVEYDSCTNNAARRSREIQKLLENGNRNSKAESSRLVQLLAFDRVARQIENSSVPEIIGKVTNTENIKSYALIQKNFQVRSVCADLTNDSNDQDEPSVADPPVTDAAMHDDEGIQMGLTMFPENNVSSVIF